MVPETTWCWEVEVKGSIWWYMRVPNRVFQSRHPDQNFPSIPYSRPFLSANPDPGHILFKSLTSKKAGRSFEWIHLASKQSQTLTISCISFHQNDDIFHSCVFTVSNELRKSKLFLFFFVLFWLFFLFYLCCVVCLPSLSLWRPLITGKLIGDSIVTNEEHYKYQ